MNELYRSRFEAYPFLADPPEDLRCDFEIATDHAASQTGLLCALIQDGALHQELLTVCGLLYHCNPTLRTKLTVTEEELDWLEGCANRLREETADRCEKFVLTQGSQAGCTAHLLRVECKALVRMLYRHEYAGNRVEPRLYDFVNLLSGYFFLLALRLNQMDGAEEIQFVSRNYKSK